MITKEVTQQFSGAYEMRIHVKTVYKIFGLTIYVVKTETLN